MASRYEGLPLALVEAMSLGRPAVVTDVADCAIFSCAMEPMGLSLPHRPFPPIQKPWSAYGNAALNFRRWVPMQLSGHVISCLRIRFTAQQKPSLP